MLCWANIALCAIPVLMFIRDAHYVLLALALANLAVQSWSFIELRKLLGGGG